MSSSFFTPRRADLGRRGVISVMSALAMPPIFLMAGLTIDIARQVQAYRALANAADAAALAGATLLSETNYASDVPVMVNAYLTAATAGIGASFTLPATVTVTADAVTVTVSGTVRASLMAAILPTQAFTATSTAGGPSGGITVKATPATATAADLNSVFIYALTSTGAKDISGRTLLFDDSNAASYPAGQQVTVTFELALGEPVAFELDNRTGGRLPANYGGQPALYGSTVGTTNVFYSSDYPASKNTMNAANGFSVANQTAMVNTGHVVFENAATACFVYNGVPVPLASFNTSTSRGTITSAQQKNVVVNGVCANITHGSPNNINPTCLELNGQTMNITWNDMGGTVSYPDTGMYPGTWADMRYTFSCAGNSTYNRVVLTHC